jgi:tight adherence protein B
MITVSALAAALAVALVMPSPAPHRLRRRLREPDDVAVGPGRLSIAVAAGIVAVLAVLVSLRLGGPPWAAVTTATVLAGSTVAHQVMRSIRLRRMAAARAAVAKACSSVCAQVRVGRVPSEALAVAAADHPVLQLASRTAGIGGDVPAALRAQARSPGLGGLEDLARAWRLSQDTGASMAGVLDQVAVALRGDLAVERTLGAELAGPRATGKLMAVLPGCGLGMGYLLGGDPVAFLVGGPAGWACLVLGIALACAGVLWIDRLARVAEQV